MDEALNRTEAEAVRMRAETSRMKEEVAEMEAAAADKEKELELGRVKLDRLLADMVFKQEVEQALLEILFPPN
ncbi:hypothetical protein SLEP1_g16020 [Rubroshorea leprosula]|uniref:Uncharacterized protein n=1 Tax=Rubroshorea leprosula TaxID=152421 RepID=A0AAV5J035_9ROSI|nr:hypothetical protein SLEP1_g16020 [Rubroshorea leprosula]